jgi:Kdo2-lipid IVA lauroyltransferase/acyltransferase
MREWLEYAAVWLILKLVGVLPRSVARALAAGMLTLLLGLRPSLRKTAEFNLRLAFPDWTQARREGAIRKMVQHLGRMAGEFARFPKLRRENIEQYLTGHIGAWELSSFAHALYGYPLHYMARPLDNARLDDLVNRYRCASGNRPIFKNESARVMLKILKDAGTVGILADQNTMPSEGEFVDFFGKLACTTAGLARVALHTDAAVVPGYAYWDETIQKYRLRFEPPVELIRTGDSERDIFENTQKFAKVMEAIIRKYPEQWIWVHKRWKTRPEGEPPLYDF